LSYECESDDLREPAGVVAVDLQCGGSGALQVQLQGQQTQAQGHRQRLSGTTLDSFKVLAPVNNIQVDSSGLLATSRRSGSIIFW